MKSRFNYDNIVFAILSICLVVYLAHIVSAYRKSSQDKPLSHVDNWQQLLKGREPSAGSRTAPVSVIEFFDYQCPYCRSLEPQLQQLMEKNPGKIALYRFDFPLERLHPNAMDAARAFRCAEPSTTKNLLQQYLFTSADISLQSVTEFLESRGEGVGSFTKCVDDQKTRSLIHEDVQQGERLGIKSTPTLIINGRVLEGAARSETLQAYIQSGLVGK